MVATRKTKANSLYTIDDDTLTLNLHSGQQRAWLSRRRFVFMLAGTQGGKTSFGPWWLWREIQQRGSGDYIAATSSYDLFKLKMLPEMRMVFENLLGIARYWAGDKVLEIKNPDGEFQASRADDPMWARVILRSAAAEGGLESTTAKGAWLDEVGQDEFSLQAWEAVLRRLSLAEGRVLGTTTPYNLGWLKQQIFDAWERGDPDIDIIQFASINNPIFPKSEFERARRTLPAWKFRMFYRGLFGRPAGMIYKDFVDKLRSEGGHKVEPFVIPRHWPRIVGIDPGGVNHAKLWIAHDTDRDHYFIYRESLSGDKTTSEHAAELLRYEAEGENVIAYAVGQKSEKQQRKDYEDQGLNNVVEPPFHDVESGIDKIISLLKQHRLFVFSDLDGLLDQLMRYSRKVDANGEPTAEIKDKNQYHFLDAMRYAVAQISEPTPIINVTENIFYP